MHSLGLENPEDTYRHLHVHRTHKNKMPKVLAEGIFDACTEHGTNAKHARGQTDEGTKAPESKCTEARRQLRRTYR